MKCGQVFIKTNRVGGHGDRQVRVVATNTRNDVSEILTQQRFSAGEPELTHPQNVHRDTDKTNHLGGGENSVLGQERHSGGRHAVRTAKIAQIRERNPQVSACAPEGVGQWARGGGVVRPSLQGALGVCGTVCDTFCADRRHSQ